MAEVQVYGKNYHESTIENDRVTAMAARELAFFSRYQFDNNSTHGIRVHAYFEEARRWWHKHTFPASRQGVSRDEIFDEFERWLEDVRDLAEGEPEKVRAAYALLGHRDMG